MEKRFTKIHMDKDNRMWRFGFGKNKGLWFFRIDLGSVGFRYKPKTNEQE